MSGLSFLACFYCPATADWLSKMCQTNFNCVYLLIQVQLANNIVGLVYLKWIFFYGWFFSRGLRNGLQQRQRLSRCFVLRNGLFYSCVLWPDSRSKRSRPWRRQDSGKEERLDVGIWTERKGEMIINSSVQSKQDCRAKHNRDGPFYLKQMAVQQALRHPNFPLLTVARIATAKMSAHGQHRPGRYECHDLLVWASVGWDVIKDFVFLLDQLGQEFWFLIPVNLFFSHFLTKTNFPRSQSLNMAATLLSFIGPGWSDHPYYWALDC